ncbi:MAG: hypothetical protein QNK36_21025 [Colwellia sp.]|nr:hypothetical protein [Colwellia sp.]
MDFDSFVKKIVNNNDIDEIIIDKLVHEKSSINSVTIHKLVELFKIYSASTDPEVLTELTQKVEQACKNKSECYVENINDISTAISNLMFLRYCSDKPKNPIDIQRFCLELIERGLVIDSVIPLLAALHYLFVAKNTGIFSNNASYRTGELQQSAILARMCEEIIHSNALRFNEVVKNGEVALIYRELEPKIKNQVRVLLKNEPECKQVGAKVTKWLKETSNNQFILDNAPKKWFKRLIDEEKYFFEEISHFPIFS